MKKVNILKLSSLTLIAASVLACGNSGGGNNTDEGRWSTTGELEYNEDGSVKFDNVYINLSTVVDGEDRGPFNTLIKEFNEEYQSKIRVNVNYVAQGDDGMGFESTVAGQIANNQNPPDLMMSHQKGNKLFLDQKLIQPFSDDLLEKIMPGFSTSDYVKNLGDYSKVGTDKQFAIPIDAQSQVIWYNKQLLTEYNDGKLPTNRQEFIDACLAAQAGERSKGNKDFYGAALTPLLTFFKQYVIPTALVENGATFYKDETNYYADWDSDANLKAFKDGFDSIRQFYYGDNKIMNYNMTESQALKSFYENKTMFVFTLPRYQNSIASGYMTTNPNVTKDELKDILGGFSMQGLFAIDSTASYANEIFGDSHFFTMSKNVTDITVKAACLEFIRWFTEDVNVAVDWANAGHISAKTSIINDEDYIDDYFTSNFIENFYTDMNQFVSPGVDPYFSTRYNAIYDLGVSAVATDDGSQDESLIKAKNDYVNGQIDLYNL
jgi:ABC-type glycerol-3-phosphate transport system substrate-binding protein